MPTPLSTENLRILRSRLVQGDRESIAKSFGLSPRTVYNVLYGIQRNDGVLEAAIRIAERREAYKADLNARVEAIENCKAQTHPVI